MTDIRDEIATLKRYVHSPCTGWDISRMVPDPEGEWVYFADIAARGLKVVREGELDVERLRRYVVQASIYLTNGDLVAAHEELAVALDVLTRQPEGQ